MRRRLNQEQDKNNRRCLAHGIKMPCMRRFATSEPSFILLKQVFDKIEKRKKTLQGTEDLRKLRQTLLPKSIYALRKEQVLFQSVPFALQKRQKDRAAISEIPRRSCLACKKENFIREGIFECDRCCAVFSTNLALRGHRTHCGHRSLPVRCPHCKKKIGSKGALSLHLVWCPENPESTVESRQRHSMSMLTRKIVRVSKLETEFEAALRARQVKLVAQARIGGRHAYDFLIAGTKILIEIDGDFWHGNPLVFQGTLSSRQKQQFRIDETNVRRARRAGFTVIRLWEKTLKNQLNEIIDFIQGLANGRNIQEDQVDSSGHWIGSSL